jgi:hypothetical protein
MKDRRGPIAAVLALLAAGAVLAADTWAPEAASLPEPATVVSSGEPLGGSYVCGVGDGTDGGQLTLVAARPAAAGAGPAEVEFQRLYEGTVSVETEPSVFPGSAVTTTYSEDEDDLTGTWVTWRDAPATAWREWRIEGDEDVPDATVAGACAAPSSDRWIVPGLSTEGGDEARLRLTNPFASAATVAVGFLTPEGAAEPLVLRNLTVPARSVREVVVNETLPEQADLTAIVEVASGRMSVEGLQISREDIGGIDGASLLQAAPDPAEEWTVPWVSDDDATSSWLWVANPGERTAPVQLTLHTAEGGELPEGLAEVSVPPGEMRRVDLTGTLPEGATVAGVTARSNGAPIVVSAGTSVSADEPAASGITVQLGAPAPDRSWVVSGGAASDRREDLHVVNPTGADAVVDVALFNGVASLAPDELQGVEVAAGSSVVLDLDEVLDQRSRWSAFVTTSSGEVVVGRVGRSTDEEAPLRLLAAPGVPSAAWSANGAGLAAVSSEGLVRDLRTATGVGGPLGPPAPTDQDGFGPDADVEPDPEDVPDDEPEAEDGSEPQDAPEDESAP